MIMNGILRNLCVKQRLQTGQIQNLTHKKLNINRNFCSSTCLSEYHPKHILSSHIKITNVAKSRFMSSYQQQFDEAKEKLSTLSEDPGNELKLKIYGLFKQSTEGTVQTKRPGMTNFVGRAKWDAWNANKDMDKETAQKAYIDLIMSLVGKEESEAAAQQSSGQKYTNLLVENKGGLRIITLNRPKKFNSLTWEMYGEIVSALTDAAEDSKTVVTAVTGAGSYYCAGNDLSNFMNVSPTPEEMAKMAAEGKKTLQSFVGAFIDFPKPLVAVINGPAIGVSVTTLGLFDAVYATDKATFHTPFTSLGQSPEGCSSIVFPRLMGYGKSSELLFFNKKITAAEAEKVNLVTEVLPDDVFQNEIWPRLEAYSKLPIKSVVYSKELVRGFERELMHKVNLRECERLEERWISEDCINAITAFFNRKK